MMIAALLGIGLLLAIIGTVVLANGTSAGGVVAVAPKPIGMGMLGIGILMILSTVLIDGEIRLPFASSLSSPKLTTQERTFVEAYTACQQFLEEKLVSPKSAVYPPINLRQMVETWGLDQYRVTSYVDSSNRMGVSIRTHFRCTVSPVSGGRWQLDDMVANE